jgi:hypothetical protein
MAAITPSSVKEDLVYGQNFRKGGQFLVLPFTTSSASDTWQAPTGINPVSVAWQATATTDDVAVTLNATTKVVTFTSAAGSKSGNLIVVHGGAS